MSDLSALLKSSVEAALEVQREDLAKPSADLKAKVLRRGRRRRAARAALASTMAVVFVAGAASATGRLFDRDRRVAAPDAPVMGAEKVHSGLGGALAGDDRFLWIGSGATSNTAGDRNGITRLDVASGKTEDGPPAVGLPGAMALGETGLWTVTWEGDMPVGGEGSPVRGAIERVDPVTLERTGHIPLENSAPYDVAVGTYDGEEVAWVADMGRAQLLRVDPSMEIAETYGMPGNPSSVHVHGRFVYVSSSKDHVVERLDAETGETTRVEVPECANDVMVAEGSLWVADYCGDAVRRIDESGAGETVTIDLAEAGAVEYAEGLVWATTRDGVVRIDPSSNERVGNEIYVEWPEDLLYAGGTMWVQASGGVYRLGEDVPPATPKPTPPPTPDPAAAELPAGVERVALERGDVQALATGAESLWTGLFEIQRLDPATGDVLAKVDPGGFVESMDFDEEAGVLWAFVEVAEKETNAVVAIDPLTNRIALGPVLLDPPGVYGQAMAAHDGVAWVAGDTTLSRVELETGKVDEIDISEHFGHPDETSGFNVAVTDDAVFVVPFNGTVVRVDAETFESAKVHELDWNVTGMVSDGSTVWLVQNSGKTSEVLLWTLDGVTGEPAGDPIVVGEFGLEHIAEHAGTVWVVHSGLRRDDAAIYGYDAGTGELVASVEVPEAPFVQSVAAGPEGVWMTTGNEFLYRFAPE